MASSVVQMASNQGYTQMEEARVKSLEGMHVMLHTSAGVELGHRAVSCLVNPEPGDLVLVSRGDRSLYVLSVLERSSSVDSGVTLGFSGPVKLSSPESMTVSSRSAHWINEETSFSTGRLSVAAKDVNAVGESFSVHGSALRMVSQSLDIVSNRISRHVKTLISVVKGHELRQVNQLSEQVSKTHLQKSERMVIDARHDLKINAERIHMG